MTDIITQIAKPATNAQTNATFQITETKLYVSVVILSKENEKWNKYRSQMTIRPQNNNLI